MSAVYRSGYADAIKPPPKPRKLLDELRDRLRTKHYSYRTEQAYVDWVRRYILFHGKRHPREMGGPGIEAFLTHLAGRHAHVAKQRGHARVGWLLLPLANRLPATATGVKQRQVAAHPSAHACPAS